MLYPELKAEGLLDKGDMEFRMCHRCKTDYEGDFCPQCNTPFKEYKTPVKPKVMLYVPGVYGGVPRRKCNDCDNFFGTDLKSCPLLCCGSENISQRTTMLLKYGTISESDTEEDFEEEAYDEY